VEHLKIGLLYVSLHNQLRKKVGMDKTISRKDFFCIIGKHFLVPKNLRPVIIKEMENRKLINHLNSDQIEVLEYDLDLETDTNKFYKDVGL